jgi:Mannosyltransferase (PIG-V)
VATNRAGGAGARVSETREDRPRIRDGVRDAVWAFLGARLLLFVISVTGGGTLPLPPRQPPLDAGFPPPTLVPGWHMLVTATQRQDAAWFLRIATAGYAPHDGSAAFFPLYPMAIRAVGWIPGVGPLGAALIVGNAAFLGALVMLHALTRLELGTTAARRTVLFCAFFPTAFFLLAPYTEPVFLLLSVSAFWFARRNRWVWAAVAGAGAAMTRNVGVLLIVALAVEALRQWRAGRLLLPRLTAAACVGLGPLAYFAYWQVRFQDFWAPLDAQANWQREPTFPLVAIWHALRLTWRFQTWWLIDVLVVGVAIAGITIAAFRVPLTYSVYAALSVLIPLTFTYGDRPLTSMPRFMAVVFPAFWGFAIAAERRRPPEAAFLVAFAAGFGILCFLFINWQPVF